MLGFVQVYQFLGPGDSEAMKGVVFHIKSLRFPIIVCSYR